MNENAIKTYFSEIEKLLNTILEKEFENIEKAAQAIAEAIKNNKMIHVYGSGHSQIFAQEMFYRAGGLAVINPILDIGSSLYVGASKSTYIERLVGYGKILVNYHEISEGDVVIVVSTSGRNPLPIEVALESKNKGATVIALTSIEFSSKFPSRHPSNKRLFEIADIVIDTHVPPGDALIEFKEQDVRAAPASTIATATILNSIVARIVQLYLEKELKPPIWVSSNLPWGDEHNKKYLEKYKKLIKYL
ncbi:MAG: sugar isomerase domain-containing protein [Candidatus Njordarchaeia archaeon]